MAYEKQTWACGDTITAEKMNHIEDGIAEALECCEDGTDDCDHPELGTLLFCGRARGPLLIAYGHYAKGVADRDASYWHDSIGYIDEVTEEGCMTGVFDGVIVKGEPVDEVTVDFQPYMQLETEGTELVRIVETWLAFDHYALYSSLPRD